MTTRRSVLQGIAAAPSFYFLSSMPSLARSGRRIFDLYRGDKRIGEKQVTVTRDGSRVDVVIDIDISVRILGLPAYSYRLQSREAWDSGRLLGLEARTNDNGTADRVTATRRGGQIEIDGSGYAGVVDGNAGTTTYWTQAFLTRPTWISTQTGKPLSVRVSKRGSEAFPTTNGSVTATRWAVRGDIGELDLFYDNGGEWVGNEFTARGEQARFVMRDSGGQLAALWTNG